MFSRLRLQPMRQPVIWLALLLVLCMQTLPWQADLPAHPTEHITLSECGHPIATTPDKPSNGDVGACQIRCDLAAAPALPPEFVWLSSQVPTEWVATPVALSLGHITPPDHPPPIA